MSDLNLNSLNGIIQDFFSGIISIPEEVLEDLYGHICSLEITVTLESGISHARQ